ncbi:MAG TPA: hypothetical protein PK156_18755 [Polyangium sp.]|nr:hypothetical protein [Polyangium sp.]
MSAAHDAHADASAGHHDAHDHFDNEPATELGPDETRTANWVPYLGLALFFSAGVACLVCSDGDKPAADKAVAVEAAPAVPVAQPPQQLRAMPAPQPGMPQPGQPGAGAPPNALKQLTPDQAREIQQRIESMKALQQQAGGQPTPPQPGAAPPRPVALPQPGGAPPRPAPPAPPAH